VRTIARGGVIAVVVMGLLAASALGATRYGTRTLRKGSTGSDVKIAQKYLTRAGFRTTADGQFGSGTARKVKAFEKKFRQHRDGKLTVKEQRKLKTVATKASTETSTSSSSSGGSSLDDSTPTGTVAGSKATINADGTANAPADAPTSIKKLIAAGNQIAHKPYVYGGGHGSFTSSGYDCSGSVSYVLHAAGLLKTPRDSTGLESWGSSGRGKWLSVYANAGHAYIRVAGLRFDTSGMSADNGSRWHTSTRSASGYVFRHASGL
jgi:cell wall-associated NlpC family hydrolase